MQINVIRDWRKKNPMILLYYKPFVPHNVLNEGYLCSQHNIHVTGK